MAGKRQEVTQVKSKVGLRVSFGFWPSDFGIRELDLPQQLSDSFPMSSLVNVAIHPSQFPEAVRRDLLESLRTRQVNHKFHYDSIKQTQKWLALHQAYSPSRNDPDCVAVYDASFAAA